MRHNKLHELPASYFNKEDGVNRCFVCSDPKYKLKYKVDHFEFPFEFQECQCGVIKQVPMPSVDFFEWFFNADSFFNADDTNNNEIWGYYDFFADESSRLKTSSRRYKKLNQFFSKYDRPLRILKIGPATGTMLHVCQENGHEVIGCDVSSRFAEYARSNYNVEIINERFENVNFDNDYFDVILLFNVVENVPNLDTFMSEINRTLKIGGLFISNYVPIDRNLVASIQKSKYFIYRPPICYIFTKKTYFQMLNKFSFTIEDSLQDVRYMHGEKLFTLLRWRWAHKLTKALRISRVNFPIYAYPSKIIISRKSGNLIEKTMKN